MSDFKHPRSYVLFCSNFKSSDHLWPIKLHTGRQLFRRQLLQSASPHTIRGSGCTGYSWEKPLISKRGGSHESVWGWGVSIEGLPPRTWLPPTQLGHERNGWKLPSVTLSHSLLPGALPQRVIFFPNVCVHTSVYMWNAISLLCNLVSHWSGSHWSG